MTLLAASVAHEIGNPLNALHIHLQLMEREVKKLKTRRVADGQQSPETVGCTRHVRTIDRGKSRPKLEQYLDVAKGEINRLDYIVTQFLQAIRPAPPQLKPASLNDVVEKTLELLRPELDNRGMTVKDKTGAAVAGCAAGRDADAAGAGEPHQERDAGDDAGRHADVADRRRRRTASG